MEGGRPEGGPPRAEADFALRLSWQVRHSPGRCPGVPRCAPPAHRRPHAHSDEAICAQRLVEEEQVHACCVQEGANRFAVATESHIAIWCVAAPGPPPRPGNL